MVSLLSFNTKKHRPSKNRAVAGGGDERVSRTGKNQEARGNRNARVPSLHLRRMLRTILQAVKRLSQNQKSRRTVEGMAQRCMRQRMHGNATVGRNGRTCLSGFSVMREEACEAKQVDLG
jgi:methylthioribose-1-phosphate isomerase